MHLRDLAYFYARTLWMCPLTHNLANDFSEIFINKGLNFQKLGPEPILVPYTALLLKELLV